MFVPTNVNVKLANVNTGHAQRIGIVLCSFPNSAIIFTMGPVYYFPSQPSNTISSGSLKFHVGFQKVTSESLEYCEFLTLGVLHDITLPVSKKIRLSSY